jgi:hypothetical protein
LPILAKSHFTLTSLSQKEAFELQVKMFEYL